MQKIHIDFDSENGVQGERTRQVHALLSHLLELGELGHPLPPERYLAIMFSCSRVTIRRVLAAYEGVSRERGRGTFAFRGPPIIPLDELEEAVQSKQFVALLTDHPGGNLNAALSPFFYSLFLSLSDAEPETRFVMVRTSEALGDPSRLMKTKGFRGLVAPGYQWPVELFEHAYRSRAPFVAVGRSSLDFYWNVVEVSWESEIAKAAEDLRINPADQVVFLGQKYGSPFDDQVFNSLFLQHLDAGGVSADRINYGEGGVFESDGYFAMRRYIARHGIPSVVIANGDLSAAGAYRALHDRLSPKQRIGRDVRIVGAGNFKITEYLDPKLSTFDFNMRHIATSILSMLADQQGGHRRVGLRRVPVSYVGRGSTAGD